MSLRTIVVILEQALSPEDVFGSLNGDRLSDKYRKLAKELHPDGYPVADEKAIAEKAFQQLQEWYRRAQDKVEAGTYGDRDACGRVTIQSKKSSYTVTSRLASGDMAELYVGVDEDKNPVLVKIGRLPANNDLLQNEARTLAYMRDEAPVRNLKVMHHIPVLLDAFQLQDGKMHKQTNVFRFKQGGVTLESILLAYPNGVDPRDMAWMLNRLLAGLLAIHQSGVIHGAITPEHMIVFPEDHDGLLVDWSYSVKPRVAIKAIAPKWRSLYPPEVLAKKGVLYGTDICMAAKCALYLVGNQAIPRQIDGLLRSCCLGQAHRPQDVFEVFEELEELLKALYGPRKFRAFRMPSETKG